MDSLARDEAARGTSYRSPFHHGDLVFAKMRGFPYWPARIDCVRPKDCNIREQGNIPDSIDFCWPIFFFGTHQISWIAESKLKMFEENRDTLGKNKHIKEAMKEALTNTGVKFQFGDGSGEVVPKMWTHGDKAKRWFRYQSDETSFVTEWDTHNRAKKRRLDSPEASRPSSSSGSSVEASEELESPRESPDLTEEQSGTNAEPVEVENESEDEEDVIIQRYREATHKIEDLSVGDFVGCMYESAYYGTVLSKNEEEKTVNVHFYTRSSHHKIYISKKKDTDTITEKRQGYIFCHIPAEKVQHGNTQVRKTKTMFLLDGVVHADIDLTEAKWRLFTAELRGDEDDIETYTDEVDRLTDEIDTLNRSTYCERSTFNVPIGCENHLSFNRTSTSANTSFSSDVTTEDGGRVEEADK